MYCKFCQHQNRNGANFCARCGRRLPKEETRKKWLIPTVCLLVAVIGAAVLMAGKGSTGNTQKPNPIPPKQETVQICQVVPMYDGAVAALYTDGTVRVSGNDALAETVSTWNKVTALYDTIYSELCDGPLLAGITESGEVLTTAGPIPGFINVKELHFHWRGIVGVTHGGKVLTHGNWENDTFFSSLTDVESLANMGDEWGCLQKDGSVVFNYDMSAYGVVWTNVKELRASGHGFYAIMNDGTVASQFELSCSGLTGAAKVVDFEDWLFGISPDGKLLTQSGGSIYTNTGDMRIDEPGLPYYGEEIDIRRYQQVADIIPFRGLILLNKDGTAEHIGANPCWDLSAWNHVRKVCGGSSGEGFTNLYSIQQDGSVILNQYNWVDQTVTTNYRGWILKDIYAGNNGVVGLTTEGTLVGDGRYANVDFSVFVR